MIRSDISRHCITATLSVVVLSACLPFAGTPSPATARTQQRPKTKKVMVMLEGSPEPMTLTLFEAASRTRFPLPFTTYVPPDIAAETVGSGEGAAVRFVANFAGTRNEHAYLQVAHARDTATERQAVSLARAIATSRGLRPRSAGEPRRFAWSRAEYDFERRAENGSSRQVGTVAVGRHGGRYFHVVLSYPADYEEGFAPRSERILAEWRWQDTGKGLARE